MAVSANYQSALTVTETFTDTTVPTANTTGRQVTHDKQNTNATYDASTTTTIDVDNVVGMLATLSSGALTINFASIAGTTATLDLTGKRLKFIKVKPTSTNTGSFTIAKGASNGYAPIGSTFSLVVAKDGEVLMSFGDASTAIASGARTLDLSGTGAESALILFVFGP